MAWTTITDTVLQVGRPIRALTMRLLRDNIAALANGDAGAPKVQNAALSDNSINGGKLINATVDGAKLVDGSVGGAKLAYDADFTYRVRLANAQAGVYDLGETAWVVSASVSPGWTIGTELSGANFRETSVRQSADGTTGGTLSGTWKIVSYPGSAGATNSRAFQVKRTG